MSDSAAPPKPSGSLEDRITSPPLKATSATFSPSEPSSASAPPAPKPAVSSSMGSWADEVSSPVAEVTNKFAEAQVDGASEPHKGSGLAEPEGIFEVAVKLSDMQQDPNNPLFSVKTFEELGLSKEILKGLYSMNFSKPSSVQEKALPLLLSNPPMNMIAQSQSGTGKTAAFVLTVLSRIDLTKPHQPQALCLAPSRELARQIEGVIATIGHFIENLHIQAAIPGVVERGKKIEASVVVGTPGTVMDLIKRRQFDASQIKVLTLDEADNMLDQQGMGEQCARVKALLPRTTQILLFSATFPEKVLKFAQNFSPNANMITLKKEQLTVAGIKQMFMDCPSETQKYDILVKLYGLLTTGSSIIFVKTRASAAEIERRMVADGHKVASLSGAQEGADRDRIIDDFREGRAKVLITTNVLARGLDVSTVSMVINYDIPMKGTSDSEADSETYLHRIGRTGRFGRIGVSISFVYDRKSFTALKSIADGFGIDLVQLSYDDWDETEELVQAVIKHSNAGANFNKLNNPS